MFYNECMHYCILCYLRHASNLAMLIIVLHSEPTTYQTLHLLPPSSIPAVHMDNPHRQAACTGLVSIPECSRDSGTVILIQNMRSPLGKIKIMYTWNDGSSQNFSNEYKHLKQ